VAAEAVVCSSTASLWRIWPSAERRVIFCPHRFLALQFSRRFWLRRLLACGWYGTPMPWPTGYRGSAPRAVGLARRGQSGFRRRGKPVEARLKAAGARYYVRHSESLHERLKATSA
jgi:hypothetical protein